MAAASGEDDWVGGGGAGPLRREDTAVLDPEEVWLTVCDTDRGDTPLRKEPKDNTPASERRSGWKTVRVFVSSTYDDFHYERDLLVKKIFPDLRKWCQKRRLHLVDCDLRWGVPENSPDETTLRACMEEIDRCEKENKNPYFLNLTSERIEWIPRRGQVHENISEPYRWVFGLSVTEMEIVHGAYRKENPNSLFLLRVLDDEFWKSLPKSEYTKFRDFTEAQNAEKKIKVLKEKIGERFPKNRVVRYNCKFRRMNPITKKVDLDIKDADNFAERIMKFFKKRIDFQYPLFEVTDDPLERQTDQQEAFMKSRIDFFYGRDSLIDEIVTLLMQPDHGKPILLEGEPGSGKSSIMCKVADRICQIADGMTDTNLEVFYHFVGAVPGSTDSVTLLQRLLEKLGMEESRSSDMATLTQHCYAALSNPNTPRCVIIIDAINQLDEGFDSEKLTWLPYELSPSVKVILSTINKTQHYTNLTNRSPEPTVFTPSRFNLIVRKDIVKAFMKRYNKALDIDQMLEILDKDGSSNPLWLMTSCEELRIWGDLSTIQTRIKQLPNDLMPLMEMVFTRFEKELGDDSYLLRATLCLLEASRSGLCEIELLQLLADDSLKEEPGAASKLPKSDREDRLPSRRWHDIYRHIGPFLRPYGDSGEGRLDFYHRILSKMVRKCYMTKYAASAKVENTAKYWHGKLADYFQSPEVHSRKLEEYPYHLIKLGDKKRMEAFVLDWDTFDGLFDYELSVKFLKYWRETGDANYSKLAKKYKNMLKELSKDRTVEKATLVSRYVQVGRVLLQAGRLDEAMELGLPANSKTYEVTMPEELQVQIKSLLAAVHNQKFRGMGLNVDIQVPLIDTCVRYTDQCIDLIRKMDQSKETQELLGRQLLLRASARVTKVDNVGSEQGGEDQALADVDEAFSIYTKLKNTGRLALALKEKAGLMNNTPIEALKEYEKALQLCTQAYGRFHPLASQIHHNAGVCAEDMATYSQLSDAQKKEYFKEA